MKKIILIFASLLFFSNAAKAQILKRIADKVSSDVQYKVNRKIDKTVDNAVDKTVDGVMNPGKSKKKSSKKGNDSGATAGETGQTNQGSQPIKTQPQKGELVFKIDDRFDGVNCKKAEISTLPGKWKENPMGSTKDVPQKYVKPEREVISKIRQMFMKNYNPVGLVVSNADVTGLDRRNYEENVAKTWPALPYSFSAYFLEFYCDNKTDTPVTDGRHQETSTKLEISANSMENIFGLDPFTVRPEWGVYPWKATNYTDQQMDGYIKWNMQPYNTDPTYFEEVWFITRDGQTPYTFVTQKEYLDWLKAFLTDQYNKSLEINATVPDPVKRAEYRKRFEDEYFETINNIDNYLKKANATGLNSTALVNSNEIYKKFTGFAPTIGQETTRILKFNEGYFNPKLPLSATQYITVYIRNEEQYNPVYYKAIEDMQKAIDVKFLKSLLE